MDPWVEFGRALGTIGPVGVTFLAGFYLWLRYGRPHHVLPSTDENATYFTTGVRDTIRDIHGLAVRLLDHESKAAEFMGSMADSIRAGAEETKRVAQILERLEYRLGGEGRDDRSSRRRGG